MHEWFDPRQYWEQRLSGKFDLRGVGDISFPKSYNEVLYDVRAQVFKSVLRATLPESGTLSVLDVGSGTGFYIAQWLRQSAGAVIGSDLTDISVSNLRTRYPDIEFIRWDVCAAVPDRLRASKFDAISAMDMLFHIIDDRSYKSAFAQLSSLLKPGGVLIFSENLMAAQKAGLHQVCRTESDVLAIASAAGLEIEHITPMFVFMNDPVRSSNRLIRAAFTKLQRIVKRGETAGRVVGTVLYPIELAAVRLLRRGPSTEVIACRKVA